MQFEMRDKRYRCSAARIEALNRLQELKSGAFSASRKSIPVVVRNMTYQSAIFQASSSLEEYLKQIFDHWVFELKRHGSPGTSIPSRARFSYFGRELSDTFSRFVHMRDESNLAKKLEDRSNVIDFAMGRSEILPHITGDIAYKDKKYPSPKNLKSLYARIGCEDIFDRLSQDLRTNAELKLQAFNDLRTSIAHGTPPSLTLLDVRRNLDDVALFVKSLDKINHKEFSKSFVGGVW